MRAAIKISLKPRTDSFRRRSNERRPSATTDESECEHLTLTSAVAVQGTPALLLPLLLRRLRRRKFEL